MNSKLPLIVLLYAIAIYIGAYLRNYYIQNEIQDESNPEFWQKISMCNIAQLLVAIAFLILLIKEVFPTAHLTILLAITVLIDTYTHRLVARERIRVADQEEVQETYDNPEEKEAA